MELKQPLKLGDEIEVEICPTDGEYAANTVDGQPFVEKFSVESLQKVIDNWKKDGSKAILCDIDHLCGLCDLCVEKSGVLAEHRKNRSFYTPTQ